MAITGFAYATGYKTYDQAWMALENMIPDEISECEKPRVERYSATRDGKKVTRFAVVVDRY